jgi:anti-sigma B factor antagonist
MPMAEVRYEREEETVVAILTGEIDMSNATSVRQQIAESVTPDDDAVIIDMSQLSFIDSAGLHAMIELGTVLDERRQQLLLCLPSKSTIRRAIEIIGLPHAVSVYADRGEAMEAVRASAMESRPIGPGPAENA